MRHTNFGMPKNTLLSHIRSITILYETIINIFSLEIMSKFKYDSTEKHTKRRTHDCIRPLPNKILISCIKEHHLNCKIFTTFFLYHKREYSRFSLSTNFNSLVGRSPSILMLIEGRWRVYCFILSKDLGSGEYSRG